MALTDKQKLAAKYRAQGMTQEAALRAAGYADAQHHVNRVFKNEAVQHEIRTVQSQTAERNKIDVDDVLDGLKQALLAAATATEMVMVWREIGKIVGAYNQVIEVDIKKKVDQLTSSKQLEALSNEELEMLAELGDGFVIEGEAVEEDVPRLAKRGS